MRAFSVWSTPAEVGTSAVATTRVRSGSAATIRRAAARDRSLLIRPHSVTASAAGSPEATPSRKAPGLTSRAPAIRRACAGVVSAAPASSAPPPTAISSRRLTAPRPRRPGAAERAVESPLEIIGGERSRRVDAPVANT